MWAQEKGSPEKNYKRIPLNNCCAEGPGSKYTPSREIERYRRDTSRGKQNKTKKI